MWQTGLVWLACLTLVTGTEAADRPPPPPCAKRIGDILFKPDDLMQHVNYLASPALRGRSGPDAEQAALYIERHFRKVQLTPLFDADYIQTIPDTSAPSELRPPLGKNVGGLIRGRDLNLRDEVILLGVHYDHLGVRRGQIYPGADDNASSVAMMLETARLISQLPQPPRRSIAFVGFDLEEQMLYGSRWFASHPPVPLNKIKLMVTADLIGRSLGDLPLPMVFMFGSEYCPQLRSHVSLVGIPNGLELGQLSTDFIGTRSDYGPFRDQRIPFLFFSTGEHPDYHTPRDRPERINAEQLTRISSLIAQTVISIANDPTTPRWNSRPEPDIAEAITMERVTEVMLGEDAAQRKPLSPTVRFVAEQTRSKTKFMGQRGTISDVEQTWLRRSAQFLLFSAF